MLAQSTKEMSGLTSIDHTELLRVGAPRKIVDRSLLIQCNPAVKVARSTEKVHPCLSVVTLVGVIDLGLCQEQDLGSKSVPFDLGAISLVKRLLARRSTVEGQETIDLDAGGGTLEAPRLAHIW